MTTELFDAPGAEPPLEVPASPLTSPLTSLKLERAHEPASDHTLDHTLDRDLEHDSEHDPEHARRAPQSVQPETGRPPHEDAQRVERVERVERDAYGQAQDHAPNQAQDEAAPAPLRGGWGVIDELLRDRPTLLRRIERGQDLRQIARAMMLLTATSSALVGAVLGAYRGGEQILYAGVKLPLVLLGTLAVCAPLYTALRRSLGGSPRLAQDVALLLSALAMTSLVCAAASPLLLMAILDGVSYHALIMAMVALGGVGGLAGYVLFFQGTSRAMTHAEHRIIATTLLLVMGLVGTQLGWTMRPYVVRPQTERVPFVRSLEGSFLESVLTSSRSARGVYRSTERSPLPRAATRSYPEASRR